jgi:hypothetical protein
MNVVTMMLVLGASVTLTWFQNAHSTLNQMTLATMRRGKNRHPNQMTCARRGENRHRHRRHLKQNLGNRRPQARAHQVPLRPRRRRRRRILPSLLRSQSQRGSYRQVCVPDTVDFPLTLRIIGKASGSQS